MNQPGDHPEFHAWLLQNEERFRLLFEDAPVAYHEIDTGGRITRVNRAECAMFGYDPSELIGRHVWELVVPEERDLCRESITRSLSPAGKLPPVQRRFLRKNGEPITVEIYQNLIEDVKRELLMSVELAKKAGIEDLHIILDPGIGFGKTREHNLQLINRLDEIRELGYPVLLGPSRKSFIGFTLDLPADHRVEGTAATIAIGIARGADIVRVHDVKEMARVAKMTDAIVRLK